MSGGGSGSREGVPGLRFVERLARLVPAYRRAQWLDEWRSELQHAWHGDVARGEVGARAAWRLRVHALGSIADAVSLRRLHGGVGGAPSVRDALRTIRRQPAFSALVVGTLALGMGAATVIFSAADGLMLRPPPYRDPQRVVEIQVERAGGYSRYADVEAARAWRERTDIFESVRAHSRANVFLTRPGEPQNLAASLMEPGLLRMLGLAPALGREFLPEEATPGRDRVVMLSDEIWRRVFGADRSIVGATVYFADEPYTVVGVMPPALRVLPGGIPQVALPLTDPPPDGYANFLMLLGRLRREHTLASARERAEAATALLEAERPRESGWGISFSPVERILGPQVRAGLLALSGAVLFLLLVACVNAAGLLYVRGITRGPEMAVRSALGGTRAVLFRQVFTESVLLAAMAGVAGTAFAWWGVRALLVLTPSVLLRFSYTPVAVNVRVLAFAFALTVATGVLFGILPAVRAARNASLRVGARNVTMARSEARLRAVIQTVQVAFAVVLLTGAGLLAHSFARLTAIDLGYDTENVLVLSYSLPRYRFAEPAQRIAFNRQLDERLRAIPGVAGISWTGGAVAPRVGIYVGTELEAEGGITLAANANELVPQASVDSAYFRVMRVPLLEGRVFSRDDAAGMDHVIIDEDLAHALWPGRSAIGQRFRVRSDEGWLTVIGVSRDVRLLEPDDRDGRYAVFFPKEMETSSSADVLLRTRTDATALIPAVHEAARSIDGEVPITLGTARASVRETVAQPRFVLTIMTLFAVVALLLAATGVYGLVAFNIAQRTREIGIRKSIGARNEQIVRAIFERGILLAAIGLALGLAGALALTRFLGSLLFGVSPLDPITLATVSATLLLACTAALIVPARRAARIDPAQSLRTE